VFTAKQLSVLISKTNKQTNKQTSLVEQVAGKNHFETLINQTLQQPNFNMASETIKEGRSDHNAISWN